ncbi:hypothetical protein G5C60_22950 [Streptomyces sp. HC44]|uniref:Uncharacterized protein n=1 Tax=Streptomyces scabichelini TaxID=2711217 RepID=A0A6G4V8I7_9ACTN|nr:hypothetical protein [Streptomyces scabichelini]NGO10366.1 hypothetical protein [Streptomyces scabichelini]
MTTTPHFILDESAKDPDADIWFAEPAGFTPLPLDILLASPDSPAAHELRTAFAPFLDAAPDEVTRQRFVAQVAEGQRLLAALREVGTVHCSIGLHRDDVDDTVSGNGQPLFSVLTLSWRDTAAASRAATAARAVTSAEGLANIEYLELPCGPATFSESVRTPSADSGLSPQALLQIHAHLPHPDCKRLVVLTLSTTAIARREQYRTILQQIAETVSFDNPLAEAESQGHRP